ncbi:MAG: hypothetical protein FJ388_25290 [Verrucomicrobia bacterium]|nr:hypothetical protein [Verrucomicrobiota bacterium]
MLSVYLDVDSARELNRQRGFEAALKNMLRALEKQIGGDRERKQFVADAERVQRFVAGLKPTAQGLVAFCRDADGFFWHQQVRVPLRNDAHWADVPYVRPLLELFDDHERYGVVLADKTRARLFTVFLGEVEEHTGAYSTAEVRHAKSIGKDRLHSQPGLDRRAEHHALWHLKHVAEMTERLADQHRFDRLLLAGPVDATSELERLLPKRLRSRLAGVLSLPMEAVPAQVLAATLEVEQAALQEEDLKLVKQLIATAAKKTPADTGLAATLNALQQNRVWRLVFAEGYAPRGSRCVNCAALMPEDRRACDYCRGALQPANDLIESMAERVVAIGGTVKQVRGPAAAMLKEAGQIGAFLRF